MCCSQLASGALDAFEISKQIYLSFVFSLNNVQILNFNCSDHVGFVSHVQLH